MNNGGRAPLPARTLEAFKRLALDGNELESLTTVARRDAQVMRAHLESQLRRRDTFLEQKAAARRRTENVLGDIVMKVNRR